MKNNTKGGKVKKKRCRDCRRVMDKEYNDCPFCGGPLKEITIHGLEPKAIIVDPDKLEINK